MAHKQYMHLERFGNTEVENIELGQVYVFPKIDGTNASVWVDHQYVDMPIQAGSRMRQLSLEADNAGFLAWLAQPRMEIDFPEDLQDCPQWQRIWWFLLKHKTLRLFGEWLVPHTFKGYREDAWRKFYVFDVLNDETDTYMTYEAYKPLLEEFGIEYIPPLAIVKNGSYEGFLKLLEQNKYLCPDNGEPGEGIVIKNYDYYNKYGRQVWAKIVRQEFKEAHYKTMGAPEINGGKMNEELIVEHCLSSHLVDKVFEKIKEAEGGWSSKYIPRLLETVFYDVVREELWDGWKKIGFGNINGKTLKALVIQRIKTLKPEIF